MGWEQSVVVPLIPPSDDSLSFRTLWDKHLETFGGLNIWTADRWELGLSSSSAGEAVTALLSPQVSGATRVRILLLWFRSGLCQPCDEVRGKRANQQRVFHLPVRPATHGDGLQILVRVPAHTSARILLHFVVSRSMIYPPFGQSGKGLPGTSTAHWAV